MTNENLPPAFPKRKTIRLQNYDYSLSGAYFVTVCTHSRKHYFGEIVGNLPFLQGRANDPHLMIEKWLLKIAETFDGVSLGAYVIMPNHVHFVVEKGFSGGHMGPPLQDIVRWFKTMTANEYIRGVRQGLYEPFEKSLWQRGYYEHIIRNEQDYHDIGEYIIHNPENWMQDEDNVPV